MKPPLTDLPIKTADTGFMGDLASTSLLSLKSSSAFSLCGAFSGLFRLGLC